jgi:hypothetical protein
MNLYGSGIRHIEGVDQVGSYFGGMHVNTGGRVLYQIAQQGQENRVNVEEIPQCQARSKEVQNA